MLQKCVHTQAIQACAFAAARHLKLEADCRVRDYCVMIERIERRK